MRQQRTTTVSMLQDRRPGQREDAPRPASRRVIDVVAALCLIMAGCTTHDSKSTADSTNRRQNGTPVVVVVNYPLEFFARRIAGDLVAVEFPAPAGVDPAYWKPDDEMIRTYQQADLILTNGADYAKWMASASLPEAKLVNTSAAVQDQYIEVDDAIVHSHGPGGEHSHKGLAFTTWLDPRIALAQATAVHEALVGLLPDAKPTLDAKFQELRSELKSLDDQLTQAVEHYEGQPMLASHPVYQYLARRCELNLKSLHWEPEDLPDDAQWRELTAALAERPARWMLWEAAPLQETADRLNALGIECLVYAPCGNVPANGDFLSVMRENIARLGAMNTAASSE